MSIRRSRPFIALACALPFAAALACGPFFPQSLLDDRKSSLSDLPEGTFFFEAGRLLPKPDDKLRAAEETSQDDPDALAKADASGLSADEAAKVKAMRGAADIDAAAKAGTGLAPELFEYTLGAIAFHKGDRDAAATHFRAVLALPPPQRSHRGLWAQYMLGRCLLASGDTDGAIAAWDVLRERALSGIPDPQGLAVASFGEQGRIAWHHGAVTDAVKLYAQQAAHGSLGGSVSLLFVARSLLAHRDQLDKALDDPLSQRLLSAYLYARSDEFAQDFPLAGTSTGDDHDAASDASDGSAASDASGAADAAQAGGKAATKAGGPDVAGFLQIVQQHGIEHFDGADRLAAGAYHTGHFDLAGTLAAKSTTALSAWVRAKLALRAGDKDAAAREYALAAKGFPTGESWSATSGEATEDAADIESTGLGHPLDRVEAERGVLALGRGEYVEALARMYAGAREYWADAAYVAERVLTTDELKSFVDGNVHAGPAKQRETWQSDPPAQLRALLARRLLRDGRDDESLHYFDDPALHAKAVALVAARKSVHDAWGSNARAQALHREAVLTRKDGLELLGMELAPDFADYGGDYPYEDKPLKPADLVGNGEPERVKHSAPVPDERFHYRYAASDLDAKAAALLPARSQAYAALTCGATRFLIDTDGKRAAALYHQYLKNGAWVKWGGSFGRACPEPDFARAKWLPYRQAWWATRHWTHRQWPWLAGGFAALVGLLVWRRRRARA